MIGGYVVRSSFIAIRIAGLAGSHEATGNSKKRNVQTVEPLPLPITTTRSKRSKGSIAALIRDVVPVPKVCPESNRRVQLFPPTSPHASAIRSTTVLRLRMSQTEGVLAMTFHHQPVLSRPLYSPRRSAYRSLSKNSIPNNVSPVTINSKSACHPRSGAFQRSGSEAEALHPRFFR